MEHVLSLDSGQLWVTYFFPLTVHCFMHYLFLFKKPTTFKVTYFKHSQQSSFCREELHLDKNLSFLMLCAPCSGLQRIQSQSCDNGFKALNWKLDIKQVIRDREREKEKSFCNELLMTEVKLLFESIFIMLTQITNGSLNQKLFQYIHAFYLQWSYQIVGTSQLSSYFFMSVVMTHLFRTPPWKKKSHINILLIMQSYTRSSELLLLLLISNMRMRTTSAGESNCSHWILLLVLYIREDGSQALFFWQNVSFWMPK